MTELMNQEKKPVVKSSAAQILEVMRGSNKLTAPDILKAVMTKDENIAMISNINDPFGYALVYGNAALLARRGWFAAADLDQRMCDLMLELGMSKKGKENRARLIIKATEAQLQQENEVDKAGGLLGSK